MQIDFHHGATYVVARLAGFDHKDADIIAYSAQYVDDATEANLIRFDNGALYSNIASAHKMFDFRNAKALANHQVWIPFHFLPGNEQKAAGDNIEGDFQQKIICKPDSPIAKDLFELCKKDKNKAYGLHRLGVFSHVFVDTFAHQGFAGVNHRVNEVYDLEAESMNPLTGWAKKKHIWGNKFSSLLCRFTSSLLPLGHGGALSFPDMPYLVWRYKNSDGKWVFRHNPAQYMRAMTRLYQCMYSYKNETIVDEQQKLPLGDRKKILQLIRTLTSSNGAERHQAWLNAIAEGEFSFGKQVVTYTVDKKGSWKEKALGYLKISSNQSIPYRHDIMSSDWKHFHDALQAHRFDVIHDLLPRYNILAA